MPPRRAILAASASWLALSVLLVPARAAEPQVQYPAKITTLDGRVYRFHDVGHDKETGSFVFYDGEEEGRVPWRDLDKIEFVGNLGHSPAALGPRVRGTRRVELTYLGGQTRIVSLIIGQLHGFDGLAERELDARDLALVDFDEAQIAPRTYAACERGHVWEQDDYRFCPYDGLPLQRFPLTP